MVNMPTMCTSCFYGYIYDSNSSSCSPDASCNSQEDCSYCPTGHVRVNTDPATPNASCQACSGNCQRCSPSNLSECTSCYMGTYLNPTNQCVACSTGCKTCISKAICLGCMSGYVSVEPAMLINNDNS